MNCDACGEAPSTTGFAKTPVGRRVPLATCAACGESAGSECLILYQVVGSGGETAWFHRRCAERARQATAA
jgi:hypothetical protein